MHTTLVHRIIVALLGDLAGLGAAFPAAVKWS